MKLKEKESGDIVYYEYNIISKSESIFPFIIVGYFMKLKQEYIGKEYIYRSSVFKYSKMKCTDVTVRENEVEIALVFENENNEKIFVSIDGEYGKRDKWSFIPIDKAEYFKNIFGEENWNTILDKKVQIGMTSEMCKMSWGSPEKINRTTTAGKSSEQWVYSNNYLYFENGVLVAIQ